MSRNAFAQCERDYNDAEAHRDHAAYELETMRLAGGMTGVQRKDLDQAIDFIETEAARARKYFRHERYTDAKKELDELIANIRAWDRGQYSPGNSGDWVSPSALIWPEK